MGSNAHLLVAWYESEVIPADTWTPSPAAGYAHLYELHYTWTLPSPGSGDSLCPVGGPYYVSKTAQRYPGVALLRVTCVEVAGVAASVLVKPVIIKIKTFNPKQQTRVVVALAQDTTESQAQLLQELEGVTMTAKLSPAAGSLVLPLKFVKTGLLAEGTFAEPHVAVPSLRAGANALL